MATSMKDRWRCSIWPARSRPKDVSGAVIIVPAMNYPAFRAGTRTSPIDKGNMNRIVSRQARRHGNPEDRRLFQRELLPRADIVLDFHSGGKTLDFLPFAPPISCPTRRRRRRASTAVEAFSRPMVDEDARDRRGRHVRHGCRGNGQGFRHHRTWRRRNGTRAKRCHRQARRDQRSASMPASCAVQSNTAPTHWLDMPDGIVSPLRRMTA